MTFVKKWLKANVKYQNQVDMSDQEISDTAQHFIEKLDVYGCSITPGSSHLTFRVRIGRPRFRGSGTYVLPVHSLLFNTYEPSNVKIVTDGSMRPKWWNKHEAYILDRHNLNPDSRRMDIYNDYSLHPHISVDGEPCLGGYSQPWSKCVSTNNIPSLVNVAQAFLNTWTRGDHYWDINNYYNSWKSAFPNEIHRREFPFTDWLTYTFAWDHLKRRIGIDDNMRTTMNNAYLFPKFYYSEDYKEQRPKDPNRHWKMFHLFNGAQFFYQTREDTEDGLKNTIVEISKTMGSALWNVKDNIGGVLGIPNNLVDGMLEDCLMEYPIEKGIVRTPGTGPRIEFSVISEFNDIHFCLDSEARKAARNIQQDHPLTSDAVNEYGKAMNRGEEWQSGGFLRRNDILECLSFYMRRNRVRAYPYLLKTLRNMIKALVGKDIWNNDLLVEGASGIKSAEILLEGLMIMKDFTDDIDEFDSVIRNHYTYQICDRYEQLLRKQIKGRLRDVKRKHRPIVHSEYTGNDSTENQLSFDTI